MGTPFGIGGSLKAAKVAQRTNPSQQKVNMYDCWHSFINSRNKCISSDFHLLSPAQGAGDRQGTRDV